MSQPSAISHEHSMLNSARSIDRPGLLIIDDDGDLRSQMKWALAQDYEVFLAEDRHSALELFCKEEVSAITLDLGLPPFPREVKEGLATLSAILQHNPSAKVVVITGREEREHALKAISQGAYDYFCKPIQIDELRVVLRRACNLYHLEWENRKQDSDLSGATFEDILGKSPQMREVFRTVRKVACTDVAVLIVGESGSGKELVARAVHRQSPWSNGPFVAINCGAIPETLLESELFGHEKGAFTGAHIQRKGRIEAAQDGTLFLDEIGELSPPLQVKLLRYLQEHRIGRIGGREEITVDARIIAATNRDLKLEMREGRFREDLYYRLGVIVISLPPLREREGDVLILAKTLLQRYASEQGKKITGFTYQALRALEVYSWPGNVRELENRIKRAVVMAEGAKLTPEDLELASAYVGYENRGLKGAREDLERNIIQGALAKNKGNITRTAVELGLSRPTLYELMEKLGIMPARGSKGSG